MDKLQNRLKLVRSQSMGMGVGQGAEPKGPASRVELREGRVTQVVLLDDRRLELVVQPRLYSGELLDIVSSHCGLREKEYFETELSTLGEENICLFDKHSKYSNVLIVGSIYMRLMSTFEN